MNLTGQARNKSKNRDYSSVLVLWKERRKKTERVKKGNNQYEQEYILPY